MCVRTRCSWWVSGRNENCATGTVDPGWRLIGVTSAHPAIIYTRINTGPVHTFVICSYHLAHRYDGVRSLWMVFFLTFFLFVVRRRDPGDRSQLSSRTATTLAQCTVRGGHWTNEQWRHALPYDGSRMHSNATPAASMATHRPIAVQCSRRVPGLSPRPLWVCRIACLPLTFGRRRLPASSSAVTLRTVTFI